MVSAARVELSIIVPTYNEAPNVAELVGRVERVLAEAGISGELIFVDDSSDDTPDVVRAVAARSGMSVRLLHRDRPSGGLGGAVLAGFELAASDWCLVMDGDLQHPPEIIPELFARASQGDADVVLASRYVGDGRADGLSSWVRTLVSKASTLVTKAMFPVRLRDCSDPMTGFFLVNRTAIDASSLQPRGFKILLEILARRQSRIAEVPFEFAERFGGESKASVLQGVHFLVQLGMLRFGRMSAFALIGALGAVANLALVFLLTLWGIEYVWAAIIAAEVTIVGNFLLLEHFVFADMRASAGAFRSRLLKSFAFNNAEAAIRIPVVALMVESGHVSAVVATAVTLVVAFVIRFVFHSLVVYAPERAVASAVFAGRSRLENDTVLADPKVL